jgi:hypothetical protein
MTQPNLAQGLVAAACLVSGSLLARELPEPRPWNDYQVILWMGNQGQKAASNPVLAERLNELGVTAVSAGNGSDTQRWQEAGLDFYVENIVNEGLCLKFRSNVTEWGDFIAGWIEERPDEALVRDYCLNDPEWLERMSGRVADAAGRHGDEQPLLYDLRDELSTTISANPFDYDFSPMALAAFREWLKSQYANLKALNAQWGSDFPTWDNVVPSTTDEMKNHIATGEPVTSKVDWRAVRNTRFDPDQARKKPERWNLASWADHRTFMDISLADALQQFREASHEVDPSTPVGIEGTQMPHAFGGYDLWRMSQVLDWVEPYDICNSREIFGSFMPDKPILCTVFEKETLPAQRRLWHLLLEGDKGCIVWWSEDVIDWENPELPLTSKGQALAPAFRQLQTPLAQLFLRAERERDPIAIHYSQPSIQVAWMLESFEDGSTWVRRYSSHEADHNRHALVRDGWLKALQDLGFSPVFLAGESLEEDVLSAARAFGRRDNRLVIADGPAGLFDERGTLRKQPNWPTDGFEGVKAEDQVLVKGSLVAEEETRHWTSSFSNYAAERLKPDFDGSQVAELREMLNARGTRPPIQVPVDARVRVHRFKAGAGARLVAFERNIVYKMREELAQVGGNEDLEKPVSFEANWYQPAYVVNLATGERLGKTNRITVDLDPWKPALFALLEEEPSDEDVVAMLLEGLE